MKLLPRSSAKCAWTFNFAIKIFLAHLVLLGAAFWVGQTQGSSLGAFQFVMIITIGILGLCFAGLQIFLAYQIGYHPVFAILWGAVFFVPMANFIAFLVLWIQTKKFLIAQGYRIVLMGAKPISAMPS